MEAEQSASSCCKYLTKAMMEKNILVVELHLVFQLVVLLAHQDQHYTHRRQKEHVDEEAFPFTPRKIGTTSSTFLLCLSVRQLLHPHFHPFVSSFQATLRPKIIQFCFQFFAGFAFVI